MNHQILTAQITINKFENNQLEACVNGLIFNIISNHIEAYLDSSASIKIDFKSVNTLINIINDYGKISVFILLNSELIGATFDYAQSIISIKSSAVNNSFNSDLRIYIKLLLELCENFAIVELKSDLG